MEIEKKKKDITITLSSTEFSNKYITLEFQWYNHNSCLFIINKIKDNKLFEKNSILEPSIISVLDTSFLFNDKNKKLSEIDINVLTDALKKENKDYNNDYKIKFKILNKNQEILKLTNIINYLNNVFDASETIDDEPYKPTFKIISNGTEITEESVDKNIDNENLNENNNNKIANEIEDKDNDNKNKDNNKNNEITNENNNKDNNDNNKKTFLGFFKDFFDKIPTCCSCNGGNTNEITEMTNLQNSKEGTKKSV